MDYKYISQLIARYWEAQTTQQEEEILRAFFSQEHIPADLLRYKPLFSYQVDEVKSDTLGAEFDEKIMSMISEPETVKAKIITLQQKLKPLFRAAAIVAIVLTLGNAVQVSLNSETNAGSTASNPALHRGQSVAISDTTAIDSMQKSSVDAVERPAQVILK